MSRLDDSDLDARWRRALATVLYTVDASGARARVAGRVARHRRRHLTNVVLTAVVTVVLVVGGAVLATRGTDHSRAVRAGSGGRPEPVVAIVRVTSEPSLQLALDRTVVPHGLVEIDYLDGGGTHVLRIDGIPDFRLEVPIGPTDEQGVAPLGPVIGRVHLGAGRYVLYCDIPGHRAAGENAVLTVR